MENKLTGLSVMTLKTMTDGTRLLLEFTTDNIQNLADVDVDLFTRYYVKMRAEYYQQQQEPHFISLACADINHSRHYFYKNKLAGNL